MILATFGLQIILILSMKFRVNWPFGQDKKVQNIFFNKAARATILNL